MNRARGFSLIELMVAVLLSAFVLMAVVGLFNQSKTNSLQNEQISRMQENGRYALHMVARDLGMAGYWGGILDPTLIGATGITIAVDCNAGGWVLDSDVSLEFENDATASPYTCVNDADILDGTDILGIKRVADNADRSTSVANVASGTLNTSTLYLKANGEFGELFRATSGTAAGPASVAFPYEMRQYYPEVIYVNTSNQIVREWLIDTTMTQQQLVDGIENLQIEFGIPALANTNDTSPDYYDADPTAAELEVATTARIYVLVRSMEQITGYRNDKTYNLGTTSVGPFNDAYYRRVYSTTVPLRNSTRLKLQAM